MHLGSSASDSNACVLVRSSSTSFECSSSIHFFSKNLLNVFFEMERNCLFDRIYGAQEFFVWKQNSCRSWFSTPFYEYIHIANFLWLNVVVLFLLHETFEWSFKNNTWFVIVYRINNKSLLIIPYLVSFCWTCKITNF